MMSPRRSAKKQSVEYAHPDTIDLVVMIVAGQVFVVQIQADEGSDIQHCYSVSLTRLSSSLLITNVDPRTCKESTGEYPWT